MAIINGKRVKIYRTMSKGKAIELIKEVKDALFFTKGMYAGKDDQLMTYMDLNIGRCEEALIQLNDKQYES